MATEEVKKINQYRVMKMALVGLTTGIWNVLGETSFSLGGLMGRQLLTVMEDEMGLEITGESAKDVVDEIGRLFVDEFGLATDIAISSSGEDNMELKVHNCINLKCEAELKAAGVTKPFVCPVLNVSQAGLRRLDYKMRSDVDVNDSHCSIVFTGV